MKQATDTNDDCPFTYNEGEERPTPEHKPIGKCVDCGDVAYVIVQEVKVCWACGYNRAS